MIGVYIILSTMVGFVGIITLLDWLGQRKDRQSRDRAVRNINRLAAS